LADAIPIERQKEIIDKVANIIIDTGFTEIGPALLESLLPMGELIGALGFSQSYIALTAIFGDTGRDFAHMVGLDYKKYAPLIIKRVKELHKERQGQEIAKIIEPTQPLTVKKILQQIFPSTAIRWIWDKVKRERKKKEE
jgi:hypothetical protein